MSERFRAYTPPIPIELKRLHEDALSKELRWQGGMQFSNKEESNMDHIKGMFEIHGENSYNYPVLFSEVDVPETEHMVYVHDSGEIGGFDLPHSVPNYSELYASRKRRERANFRLLTRDYIEDIELRAYVRQIYKRYEQKAPDDKVANYVHLVDKVQATRFGTAFVFPARKLRTRDERLQQINHVYALHTLPAKNLFRLVSHEAQEELMEFMDNELLRFRENGYREAEVNPYRKQMQDTLLSQREVILL